MAALDGAVPHSLLSYPLEILYKTVRILVVHPGEARVRIREARLEFAYLAPLILPPDCAKERDEILAEFERRDKNISGMRNSTASRLAARILALEHELRAIYNDDYYRLLLSSPRR